MNHSNNETNVVTARTKETAQRPNTVASQYYDPTSLYSQSGLMSPRTIP